MQRQLNLPSDAPVACLPQTMLRRDDSWDFAQLFGNAAASQQAQHQALLQQQHQIRLQQQYQQQQLLQQEYQLQQQQQMNVAIQHPTAQRAIHNVMMTDESPRTLYHVSQQAGYGQEQRTFDQSDAAQSVQHAHEAAGQREHKEAQERDDEHPDVKRTATSGEREPQKHPSQTARGQEQPRVQHQQKHAQATNGDERAQSGDLSGGINSQQQQQRFFVQSKDSSTHPSQPAQTDGHHVHAQRQEMYGRMRVAYEQVQGMGQGDQHC
jgi:hypothetical protein